MKVSKEAANYFKDQCMGDYNGHMSLIPYHPHLYNFVHSHCLTYDQFPQFLRAVADQLEGEEQSDE